MILDTGEYDLSKLFALIAELGESLNENRSLSVSLYAQANDVRVCRVTRAYGLLVTHVFGRRKLSTRNQVSSCGGA